MMPTFDIALDAKSTIKERIVWTLYLGLLFFLLYGLANQLASLTAPHPSFVMEWEYSIPFIELFIIPYMSSDLIFVLAFLLPYSRLELRVLGVRVLFIILVSVMVFMFYPLAFTFEKPHAEYLGFLFKALEADLPFNQLPSLHVSFAIILWYSMAPKISSKIAKITLFVWFMLIIISTLLVYQHHFIDIPTGAMVGFLAIYLISPKRDSKLLLAFSTPRGIKMALYYLLGAIVLTLLALSTACWIFGWMALSMLLVSISYAFGWEWMIVSKNSQANTLQKLFLLPYFIGNYLSLQYYSRKLTAYAKVEKGLYVGRYLKAKEYQELIDNGITHSLNLALEQQFHTPKLKQKRLAFLDQTIQDPHSLHQAVLYIQSHKDDGVYLHCALGLSRSILVVGAWLLHNGKSLDEVYKHIETIRPNYVRSKYMRVNLEIYREFINSL